MTRRIRTAVLISGGGSNLQALIDACATPDFPAEICLVISNKAEAYGLTRAENAGIPILVIPHQHYPDRTSFEQAIHAALEDVGTEIVCLAGFMRILGAEFVEKWTGRMLNIHPSLLPAYKGLHTHQRAIEAGEKIAGCTVHHVIPDLDAGEIILQAEVPVLEDDTAKTLAARVLVEEHRIYPAALKMLAESLLSRAE
jgi:phosphoribosylglycinamide formyltransferase-1